MAEDVRWKQRFSNFQKAFLFFEKAVEQKQYNPIEIGGLVQSFEFTFELGWKTMKDYLYEQGTETKFPRETLKEGYATQIIEDGHTWIEMLEKRNELSHTYNDAVAAHAVQVIQQSYYPAIKQVYEYFKKANAE
jgi:nucleotidyltransferase substrate binding protein (TIGR01987 family)